MSRRRKALIAAGFTYVQTFLGIAVSLYVTRFLVRTLGKDMYGVWLASGALLAYAALSDFGIFGVFPWLVAEADGKKDLAKMRSVLAHGVVLGALGGGIYAATSALLWSFFPSLLHLSEADRTALSGPVLLLVAVTALTFPLRLLSALRTGLQDYKFMGYVIVGQTLLGGAITVLLAKLGFGLHALAAGTAFPPVLGAAFCYFRTRDVNPDLLVSWPRINWPETQPLVTSGLGQWLGSLGWQMAFATDGVVIAYLGARDAVPMFVITSRLGLTLMQMGWGVPDAALVGLAQLNAEGNAERTNEVVAALIRLHLLVAGGVGCVVLSINAGFVQAWIGRDLFGGIQLNAVFAIDLVVLSAVHAIVTPAAVLGKRVQIGALTVANGVSHVLLAVLLGKVWGLRGVAASTTISALVTSIPIGLRLLAATTTLKTGELVAHVFRPWLLRLIPAAGVALVVGWQILKVSDFGRFGPLLLGCPTAGFVGLAYLFAMKNFLRGLPFGSRISRLLIAARLLPREDALPS